MNVEDFVRKAESLGGQNISFEDIKRGDWIVLVSGTNNVHYVFGYHVKNKLMPDSSDTGAIQLLPIRFIATLEEFLEGRGHLEEFKSKGGHNYFILSEGAATAIYRANPGTELREFLERYIS